ncbi:hypothetical protein SH449x_004668 [Pirellulaceae bacterium SH449]
MRASGIRGGAGDRGFSEKPNDPQGKPAGFRRSACGLAWRRLHASRVSVAAMQEKMNGGGGLLGRLVGGGRVDALPEALRPFRYYCYRCAM